MHLCLMWVIIFAYLQISFDLDFILKLKYLNLLGIYYKKYMDILFLIDNFFFYNEGCML